MTFAFLPFYDLLLKADIKEKIMIKIKYIQAYKDWCDFDLNINNCNIGVSLISYEDVKRQCAIWKDISKLSIDLWSDYDYYQQFIFENKYEDPEYNDRLLSLGYIYNDGMWKSISKPSDDVVQTNVFVYCLYQLICYEMKRHEIGVLDKALRCSFCNYDIKRGEDKCSTCNAKIEEIKVHRLVVNENEIKNSFTRKDIECDDEHFESADTNNDIKWMSKKIELFDEGMSSKASLESKESTDSGIEGKEANDSKTVCTDVNVEEKNRLKWKCSECSRMNSFILVNCAACEGLRGDGTWTCDRCEVVNGCVERCCMTCGEASDQVLEGNRRLVERDHWQCETCKGLSTYEVELCGKCGGHRVEEGVWTCPRCSLINKCAVIECGACLYTNRSLSATQCEQCQSTSGRRAHCSDCALRKSRWQCSFTHCREWNESLYKYCGHCKLASLHSRVRGDPVSQWTGDAAISVWICYRCSSFNGLSYSACVACGLTRYKRRYCDKCSDYNDGLSHNCDKCYGMLT